MNNPSNADRDRGIGACRRVPLSSYATAGVQGPIAGRWVGQNPVIVGRGGIGLTLRSRTARAPTRTRRRRTGRPTRPRGPEDLHRYCSLVCATFGSVGSTKYAQCMFGCISRNLKLPGG